MTDMNVEERTLKVREACFEQFARLPVYLAERLADAITAAITAAVEAERAACIADIEEAFIPLASDEYRALAFRAIEARALTPRKEKT